MLLGDRLVGKDHHSSSTDTHKEDNQKTSHAPTSLHNGSPYVHATGLTNLNKSISQIQNYSTSMTLISPSSYLKTIIKYQTSHSIQCTFYDSFYYTHLGCWYVSNVSIIFDCSMLLYYQPWMFYMHLLYTFIWFLGLTY